MNNSGINGHAAVLQNVVSKINRGHALSLLAPTLKAANLNLNPKLKKNIRKNGHTKVTESCFTDF